MRTNLSITVFLTNFTFSSLKLDGTGPAVSHLDANTDVVASPKLVACRATHIRIPAVEIICANAFIADNVGTLVTVASIAPLVTVARSARLYQARSILVATRLPLCTRHVHTQYPNQRLLHPVCKMVNI